MIRILARIALICLAASSSVAAQTKESDIKLSALIGHSGSVIGLSYAPSQKWLLSHSYDGTARLWEVASGREVRQFTAFPDGVSVARFSHDGTGVFTGGHSGQLQLWNVESGHEIGRFIGHTAPIQSIATSRGGKLVATGAGPVPADKIIDPTVRVWAIASGQPLVKFEGHTSSVRSVLFSADDSSVLSASSDGTVRRWDIASGRQVAIASFATADISGLTLSSDGRWAIAGFEGSGTRSLVVLDATTLAERRSLGSRPINAFALAPNGSRVAAAYRSGEVDVWDTETGKLLSTLAKVGDQRSPRSLAWSPDGSVLQIGFDSGSILSADVSTALVRRFFGGRAEGVTGIALSKDGRILAAALGGKRVAIWDLESGRQTRSFLSGPDVVASIAMASDGSLLATGSGITDPSQRAGIADNSLRLWSATDGRLLATMAGHLDAIVDVHFLEDGKRLATASADGTARLWNIERKSEIARFGSSGEKFLAVALSPDEDYLAAATESNAALVWSVKTGQLLAKLQGPSSFLNRYGGSVRIQMAALKFSHDGKKLFTASHDGILREWSWADRQLLLGHSTGSATFAFALAPDGNTLVTAGEQPVIQLSKADVAAGARMLVGHDAPILHLAATEKRIVSASSDCTIRVWDAASGAELIKLISFRSGGWAAIDPEGNFDEPNAGNGSDLYWVAGLQTLDLARFKERFYRPGLIAQRFASGAPAQAAAAVLRKVALGPEVSVSAGRSTFDDARLSIVDQGGGVGTLRVKVDGKLVLDKVALTRTPSSHTYLLTTKSLAKWLDPSSPSTVTVDAFNADGSLSGPVTKLEMSIARPFSASTKPRLWVLAIGISEYVGSDGAFDLQFAANDASDMASSIFLGGEALFGKGQVDVQLIASGKAPASRPTKTRIRTAFDRLQAAKSNDVVVVYFSGHGLSYHDEYYFPTEEVNSLDISDAAVRQARTISGEEIGKWMATPARKQAVIFDTCAAGAVGRRLVRPKSATPDIVRALDRMRDRAGLYVLMGSASDKESYEASPFERGLLTHALLEGLRGAATFRDDKFVAVSSLFDFAKEQVQDLAPEIESVQIPFVFAPNEKSESFDIAALDSSLRSRIPFHSKKAVLVRPMMLNMDTKADDLALTPKLTQALREGARGDSIGNAPYVFYDVAQIRGGVSASGFYTSANGRLALSVVVRGDKAQQNLTATCPSADPAACVRDAAKSIGKAAPALASLR
ncbi:caspase family protein [Pseudorhodoferax soli]|uniref:WD40 repeat protein n=1 Tax=Pseudorhodoferax soli TaxID=545864 RepID=A0A368XWS0_9BURK|nr:caspase family protein [Pseudorhodoferax soli]RCW72412.1 WD40 repeat protein [Pseudorhodoferax soli]